MSFRTVLPKCLHARETAHQQNRCCSLYPNWYAQESERLADEAGAAQLFAAADARPFAGPPLPRLGQLSERTLAGRKGFIAERSSRGGANRKSPSPSGFPKNVRLALHSR